MSTMLGLRDRELGRSGSMAGVRSVAFGVAEIRRLGLARGTRKGLLTHAGCINCVSWSSNGSLLLTGSDDRRLKLWDARNVNDVRLFTTLETGHHSNIFDAQFVPGSNFEQVVSCAREGTLRLNHVDRSVDVALLDMFETIYGFAFWEEHGSGGQVLFTAQEDGEVFQIDLREGHRAKIVLQRTTSNGIPMSVRTLAMPSLSSPHSRNLLTLGGDGPDIEVYDLRVLRAASRKTIHQPVQATSNESRVRPIATVCPKMLSGGISPNLSVSSLTFSSNSNELLANYQSSMAFAFEDPLSGRETHEAGFKAVYGGHLNSLTVLKRAVYFGPNDEYVCCGSDTGHIWVYDRQTTKVVELLYGDSDIVNGIEPHPSLPVFATYGLDSHAKVWTVGGDCHAYGSDLKSLDSALEKMLEAAVNLCVYPEKEVRQIVRKLRHSDTPDSSNDAASDTSSSMDEAFRADVPRADGSGGIYWMNSQGERVRLS